MVHEPGSLPLNPEFLPDEWWSSWGMTAQSAEVMAVSGAMTGSPWPLPGRHPPRFVLEEVKFVANPEPAVEDNVPLISGIGYYRILGRGTGIAANSTHVTESIFARPWRLLSSENGTDEINCKAFRPWYDCGRMAYRERR